MEPDLLSVVSLRDQRALEPELVGTKAAGLALSAAAGLPVLPGFAVLPLRGGRDGGGGVLRAAWRGVSRGGTRPLAVRASFSGEGSGEGAGVLDVRGWEAFLRAVETVFASAAGTGRGGAVLVQPMLRTVAGGVVSGAGPVAGRADRVLVRAVRGGPDRLVGGGVQGALYELTPRGRVVARPEDGQRPLGRAQLWRLARLARRTRKLFDGPQDMEFGFDQGGALWLFQSWEQCRATASAHQEHTPPAEPPRTGRPRRRAPWGRAGDRAVAPPPPSLWAGRVWAGRVLDAPPGTGA